jgi:hypothetical protein
MSSDVQLARAECAMVIAKVLGSSSDAMTKWMSKNDLDYLVSVCVSLVQCAVDGAKPPDASIHPTLSSATVSFQKRKNVSLLLFATIFDEFWGGSDLFVFPF